MGWPLGLIQRPGRTRKWPINLRGQKKTIAYRLPKIHYDLPLAELSFDLHPLVSQTFKKFPDMRNQINTIRHFRNEKETGLR